jgi:hypothetical protein
MFSCDMYPEPGISSRRSVIRSVVDKSSFWGTGNGMPYKSSDRKRGANPPRNDSGRTGGHLSSDDESCMDFSSGNGTLKAPNFFNSEFGTPQRRISHTRSRHFSAAMILRTPRSGKPGLLWQNTMIGKAGQTLSMVLVGVLFVQ